MKFNILIFSVITLISLYHYIIHNGLEKTFSQTYFNYNFVKRPLSKCSNSINRQRLGCIGMPSGHAETSSILFFLIYFNKFIPLWVCLLSIFLICIQRIIFKMHTLSQVVFGVILGFIYAYIYNKLNFSLFSFLIIFSIGFILVLLSVLKIDQEIAKPIPDWVDKSMYKNIKKKQESPFYIKTGAIYANAIIQNRTFITWKELERYLDEVVNRINNTGIKYDAVVGIKTGGAIISDYISLKLGLPNYKIKLSREEYNCDKGAHHIIDDIVKKNFYQENEYMICEGINDNLEGKNIILIDELVSTGKTMKEAYNYLKEQKYANIIYPTCIAFFKYKYKYNDKLYINNILNETILIWPWGYDN